MAMHCHLCDVRHPVGGTRIFWSAEQYIEFCPACGDLEVVVGHDNPEVKTLNQLFELESGEEDLDVEDYNAWKADQAESEAEERSRT